MRKIFTVLLLWLALPVFAGNRIGNEDIVEMVKLGLEQQIISAKIDASANDFDTSTKALAALRQQGVPAAVISKMIEAGSTQHSSVTASSPVSSRATIFDFVDGTGSKVELSPVRVTSEMSYRKAWIPFHVSGPETFMFIQGRHASLHTSRTPEFVTSMDPLNVRLIHLGQKNERESRYVVFSGSTTDREVQVDNKNLGNDKYGITPIEPLQAGEEYAFLVIDNMPAGFGFWAYFAQNTAAARAYDFAVE